MYVEHVNIYILYSQSMEHYNYTIVCYYFLGLYYRFIPITLIHFIVHL